MTSARRTFSAAELALLFTLPPWPATPLPVTRAQSDHRQRARQYRKRLEETRRIHAGPPPLVGASRNAPCACGSGKKAKRCCGGVA